MKIKTARTPMRLILSVVSLALGGLASCLAAEPPPAKTIPLEPFIVSSGFERVELPVPGFAGGTMVKLNDGRILLVTNSHQVGMVPEGKASLIGLFSSDGGQTWGKPQTFVHESAYDVGLPMLFRTRAGKLREHAGACGGSSKCPAFVSTRRKSAATKRRIESIRANIHINSTTPGFTTQ